MSKYTFFELNEHRDFSNGYMVAEVVAWYYPQEIQMHSYSNGTSIQTKLGNWQQLERVSSLPPHDFFLYMIIINTMQYCTVMFGLFISVLW